jgi:hypothetical protein
MFDFRINTNPTDVDLTITIMQGLISKAKEQTKDIAADLLKQKPKCIAKAIWEYQRKNYNYEIDPTGIELIRLPVQSYTDRQAGIDCEDFALMAAGIVLNLSMKCHYRVVDFYGTGWAHIYLVIICPETGKEIVLDATNQKFNFEDKYKAKKDYNVMSLLKPTGLNGNIFQSDYPSLLRQRDQLLEMKRKYTRQEKMYAVLTKKIGDIDMEIRMREKRGFLGDLPTTSQLLQLRGPKKKAKA